MPCSSDDSQVCVSLAPTPPINFRLIQPADDQTSPLECSSSPSNLTGLVVTDQAVGSHTTLCFFSINKGRCQWDSKASEKQLVSHDRILSDCASCWGLAVVLFVGSFEAHAWVWRVNNTIHILTPSSSVYTRWNTVWLPRPRPQNKS